MKIKKLKKFNMCLAGLLAVGVGIAAAAPAKLTASANSGPTHWSGVTASGVVVSDENCPIEVESEVLTFDIKRFIDRGSQKEDFEDYSANFTAEYTFKNPTANEVSAKLAFPLGQRSDYGYWEKDESGINDKYISLEDMLADKYKVTVDGEIIEAQTRYTFHAWNEFDFSKESKRICDGYREHEYFKRDMVVYGYEFRFLSDEKEYFTAEATIKDCANLRFAGDYGSLNIGKNKTTISYSVKSGEQIKLYAIGGELNAEAIEWRFYKTSGFMELIETAVKAQALYIPTDEVMLFEDYVFKGYSWGNEVSETERSDYYNAALDYIDEYLQTDMLPKSYTFLQDSSYVMRWFVYDLNFAAGQTVKNSVSAPLYPGGYYNYEPYVYYYNYLLSPAQNWNGFKSLEIRINTPYYLINSSLEFEKNDFGYLYKSDGLPNDELNFELCEVENPEHHVNYGYTILFVIIILIGAACLIAPLTIIIIFIVWLVKRSKKRDGNADKSGKNGFKPMNTFNGEK